MLRLRSIPVMTMPRATIIHQSTSLFAHKLPISGRSSNLFTFTFGLGEDVFGGIGPDERTLEVVPASDGFLRSLTLVCEAGVYDLRLSCASGVQHGRGLVSEPQAIHRGSVVSVRDLNINDESHRR
ncbi:MAG TPA: hypothetical protein VE174_01515 [Actinomycetota bacterium]|jgi:hypothetical protein|nr:hypothetical protein [Actinomycetota bacterium]